MIALLQRVTSASVTVAAQKIACIEMGLLVFVAVTQNDSSKQVAAMAERLLHYRCFSDDDGKMNQNVMQKQGDILLVSQFTLAADTRKGLRPSFSHAAAPDQARTLCDELADAISQQYKMPASGQFGADMQVALVNDGPVTFWLEVD